MQTYISAVNSEDDEADDYVELNLCLQAVN